MNRKFRLSLEDFARPKQMQSFALARNLLHGQFKFTDFRVGTCEMQILAHALEVSRSDTKRTKARILLFNKVVLAI